jgi:predicted Zn-dependent protease
VTVRSFLLAACAVLLIGWLTTGLRAAIREERGTEEADRLSRTFDLPTARRASREFERARRLNPDSRPLLLEAGILFFFDPPRARALVEEVIDREPRNAAAWGLLASGTSRTDPAVSARARARARELSPTVPDPD